MASWVTMIQLHSPEIPGQLMLDATTGLPVEVRAELADDTTISWPLRASLSVEIAGREERDPTGGLRYVDTEVLDELTLQSANPRVVHSGTSLTYELDGCIGPLGVVIQYEGFANSPIFELRMRFTAEESVVIRQAKLVIETEQPPGAQWRINAPGNCLHRNAALNELGEETLGLSPIGGLRGSSGVLTISDDRPSTLTLWPNTASEVIYISVDRVDTSALRLTIATELGAQVDPERPVDIRFGCLDLQPCDFGEVKEQMPSWFSRYGLTTPPVKPAWVQPSSIYEVQIGTSVFWGGYEYTRYPAIADLTADLDRIAGLGFSVLQLMPRQPYPSYNVHDYYDIDTSYGDRGELETLVRECHRRGMRVILDVLLHGVLDQESINAAVAGVESGPYADRLHEPPGDSFSADVSDWATYLIAWSRHIMDFAPHWRGGSPPRTPLEDEHPDWFYRDSAGNVTSIYTKAFDARSISWQRYFRTAMLYLLNGLDVDGFRFDAPTYNEFANWSPWARHRASASPLGCISLFVDLRRDIKRSNPEALMYTEPSGHLLRRSMDLNYNYDEQWLVTALAQPEQAASRGVRTARQFAEWMEDRDAFLPAGSQTAHHIDSHDTFWWPAWGAKWRREQFPIEMVRALTAAFISLDGPFMMFTGGEEGIEDVLVAFNSSRRDDPELWSGQARFMAHQDPNLLHMRRITAHGDELCVLVNFSVEHGIRVDLETESGGSLLSDGVEWLTPHAIQLAPLGILLLRSSQAEGT